MSAEPITDSGEQGLVEATLRRMLDDDHSPLDDRLAAFGMPDLLRSDPRFAIPLLFTLLGERQARSRYLNEVVLGCLPHVDPLSSGPVVLPAGGSVVTAAQRVGPDLVIDGVAFGPLDGPLIVPVSRPAGSLALAVLALDEVRAIAVSAGGLDPELGLVRLRGRIEPAPVVPEHPGDDTDWSSAVALARIALAYEIIGAVRAALGVAVGHAKERVQFGRAIGSFQAVKHRLADALVAIEVAQAAADAAIHDPTPLAAMVAKSLAGTAGKTAGAGCQQVLGGIGFTWEHPLHHALRRARTLDHILGPSTALRPAIGAQIRRTPQLPRSPALQELSQ